MTFLNKKERVIEIELTSFGKHLLSNGRLKPEYYAFFDDDVIYDKRYAGGTATGQNPEEPQNDIHDRIKEDLQLSCIPNFSSREESVEEDVNMSKALLIVQNRFAIGSGFKFDENTVPPSITPKSTEYYNSSYALGTANLGTNYKSAWNVGTFKGRITGSVSYLSSSSGYTQEIPQLDMAPITFKSVVSDSTSNLSNLEDQYTTVSFADGSLIRMYEDSILVDVTEEGVDFENENFEIEVFHLTSSVKPGVPAMMVSQSIPLMFRDQKQEIKNGILLDNDEMTPESTITESNEVEYYFEILVDDEIDKRLLCERAPTDKKLGIFSQRNMDCQELERQEKISTEGLYSTDVTDNNFSEDC